MIRHLKDEGFTYLAHMKRAFGFSWTCFSCGLQALIHGLCPWWCQKSSEKMDGKLQRLKLGLD